MLNFKKNTKLTATGMIEQAGEIVNGAVSMFKKAIDEIDKANAMLSESKITSEEKIKNLETELTNTQNTKSSAENAIEANLKLKEKLSNFIN